MRKHKNEEHENKAKELEDVDDGGGKASSNKSRSKSKELSNKEVVLRPSEFSNWEPEETGVLIEETSRES